MSTILVVEDEPANAEILQRLLSSQGYQVLVAGNKQAAIDTVTAESIDLILMDIGMPDEEGGKINKDAGLEATLLIKSNPETKSVPIIATSASAMLDERKKFLDAGCDDVQSKPFEFGALVSSIKAQIDRLK